MKNKLTAIFRKITEILYFEMRRIEYSERILINQGRILTNQQTNEPTMDGAKSLSLSDGIPAPAHTRRLSTLQFSMVVQEKNVAASMNRQAAIDAAPDRATARDRTEALDALRRAQDSLDNAKKDLQLAILRYINNTGQMRVARDGKLIPIPGMSDEEVTGPGLIDTSP